MLLLDKIFPITRKPITNWQPVHRNYLRNKSLEIEIYEKGFATAGILDIDTLNKITSLYNQTHNFQRPAGGMFYSLYSRDIDYRRKVHEELNQILNPLYESLFQDYRVILNSFIVKVSGPESEFCLHQDSTGIDETKFSNLSIWIPLQGTNMQNGCMCVVPYSHRMFSPFRGISFPAPFEKIESTVRKFLQPLELKSGEVLLFDNRLIHNSVINQSGKDRVVVMAGIYPSEAPLVSVYKDEPSDSPIEIIAQDDNYLLTYPNFLHDCRCRPETGTHVRFVNWDISQVTEKEFLLMCKKFGLQPTNIPDLLETSPVQKGLDDPFAKI